MYWPPRFGGRGGNAEAAAATATAAAAGRTSLQGTQAGSSAAILLETSPTSDIGDHALDPKMLDRSTVRESSSSASSSSSSSHPANAADAAAAAAAAQRRPLMEEEASSPSGAAEQHQPTTTEQAGAVPPPPGYDSDEEVIGRHKRTMVQPAKARALPEQYRQYVQQSWLEIRRNKCHYCIGCSSVFLVVFVVAVALSVLNYSAILFLGLSEAQVGQIDLELTPSTAYFSPSFLNYTEITAAVAANGTAGMTYSTFRDLISGSAYSASTCVGVWNASDPRGNMDWSYYHTGNVSDSACSSEVSPCLNYNCQPGAFTTMLLLNSTKEQRMGLGRSWPYGPVPYGSCYVTANLARALRLSVGSTVIFSA